MIPDNYSTISLFGIEMNPPRGFPVGPLDIRLYGVVIALGLILAVAFMSLQIRSKQRVGQSEFVTEITHIMSVLTVMILIWKPLKKR